MPGQAKKIKAAWKKIKGRGDGDVPQFVEKFIRAANITCLKIQVRPRTFEAMWCVPYLCVDAARFEKDDYGGVQFYPTISAKIVVCPSPPAGYYCRNGEKLTKYISRGKQGYISWHNLALDVAWTTATNMGVRGLEAQAILDEVGRLVDAVQLLSGIVQSMKPLPPTPQSTDEIVGPAPPSRAVSEEE